MSMVSAFKDRIMHVVDASVYSLFSVLHALRLFYQWPLVIGHWEAPLWISWIAVFVGVSLAALYWGTVLSYGN